MNYALNLPPEKAIEYFKSKDLKISWNWQDIWQEANTKAFTVAKVTKLEILQDIKQMCDKALEEGITFEQFKKELAPKLKEKGWWGKTETEDGETVQMGSNKRLELIYRTNTQTAYMAGRWSEIQDEIKFRPYLQYVAIMDFRTRPAHGVLNKKIFKADDPFWNTHFPPNGFRCRCDVRSLDAQEIKKRGLKVEDSTGRLKKENITISKKTGEVKEVTTYTDPETGATMAPDPGWNYNVGKQAFQPKLDKYEPKLAQQYINESIKGPDFEKFFEGKTEGDFPIAVLEEQVSKKINAKSQIVYLSNATLLKNKTNHPEILLSDYQKLNILISEAQKIIEKDGRVLVFIKKEDKYYFSVVKTTEDKQELYLTSFRPTDLKDISREMKKGRMIKNEPFE